MNGHWCTWKHMTSTSGNPHVNSPMARPAAGNIGVETRLSGRSNKKSSLFQKSPGWSSGAVRSRAHGATGDSAYRVWTSSSLREGSWQWRSGINSTAASGDFHSMICPRGGVRHASARIPVLCPPVTHKGTQRANSPEGWQSSFSVWRVTRRSHLTQCRNMFVRASFRGGGRGRSLWRGSKHSGGGEG